MTIVNMLVLDQLMGLKVALQNPLFHLLFFIILCCTNVGDSFSCNERNYRGAYIFLISCHVFAFIPFTTQLLRFSKDWKCLYFEKALELLNLILYLLAIFYVQDVLYFDIGIANCMERNNLDLPQDKLEERCDSIYCDYNDLGDLRQVFELEVFVFYLQVFSLIVWQSLEYFGLLKIDVQNVSEENETQDSIEVHQADFGILSANFVSAIATFIIIAQDSSLQVPEDQGSYGWSLYMNALLNVSFTILLYCLMTDTGNDDVTGIALLCLFCWLMTQIIINIVVVCKNGKEYQPLSFYWTVGMIPFLILMVLNIVYQKMKEQAETEQNASLKANAETPEGQDDDYKQVEEEEAEKKEEFEIERLPIGDDYYAVAFCSTLNKAKEQCPNLGPFDFVKYFYNVLFVVVMQFTLLFLVSLEMYSIPIVTCHFYILVARFMCALLLHMTCEPEVRQAILMYRYFVNHSIKFDEEQELRLKEEQALQEGNKNSAAATEAAFAALYDVTVEDKFKGDQCKNGHETTKAKENPEWFKEDETCCAECEEVIDPKAEGWRICDECKYIVCLECVKKKKHEANEKKVAEAKIPSTYKELKFMMIEQIEEQAKEEIWTEHRFNLEVPKYTFSTYYPALFIPLLQMITALFTEFVSLVLIAQQMAVMDVVMNFVALAVISEIDNMFSDASQDKNMKQYIDDHPDDYQPLICNKGIEFEDRHFRNKCQYALYKFLDFNHMIWYFYLFPFLCIILNFYWQSAENCERLGLDESCSTSPFGIE